MIAISWSVAAEMANLSPEDREDPDLAGSTLIVRIKNDFLQSGVKIIDSPGRNENKVLDEIITEHLKSVFPFIVYVIDGKNLLTEQVGVVTDDNVVAAFHANHTISDQPWSGNSLHSVRERHYLHFAPLSSSVE